MNGSYFLKASENYILFFFLSDGLLKDLLLIYFPKIVNVLKNFLLIWDME